MRARQVLLSQRTGRTTVFTASRQGVDSSVIRAVWPAIESTTPRDMNSGLWILKGTK
jgi:hypothetical protein